MLRDDGAVDELLLACGSSGEAREALDVLSAADGEGERGRALAVRPLPLADACAARVRGRTFRSRGASAARAT